MFILSRDFLADQAINAAASEREVDAVKHVRRAFKCFDVEVEIANGEQSLVGHLFLRA